MSIGTIPQDTVAHPYPAWLDLVGDLLRSNGGFPRRALARELARTFRAQVSLEWSDPDGARGVEPYDPTTVRPDATWPRLLIPYRFFGSSHRAFVLTRAQPAFTHQDTELAHRLQSLLALLDRQSAEATPGEAQPTERLTEREVAVVELLSEGYTAAAIAHRLGISPRTVHVHLRNVYRKFGVNDRLLAARIFRDSRRSVVVPA